MKKSNNIPTESVEIDLVAIVATWPERFKMSGKTQEEAAAESEISTGQLSQYLRGLGGTPSIQKFQNFENYLRGLGV